MASTREFSLLVKIMGAMDPSFSNATNLTKRQLQTFKNDIDTIDKVLWGGLTKAAKLGLATAAAAGTATVVAGKKAVEVGSEFEKAMSQWAAVSNASVAQYNLAEQAALRWGRQTTKTAKEGADALTYMATAGWDVERSIEALPKVLKLSEATNLDLAHTSDLVTNAMAATGSEAEDLTRVLDIAAMANNKSNQTAEQLLLAWRKTGANLENLHVDVAESATAIGMLSNRGKKAEEAGTALNAVLINMTTGAGQAGKMMEKLGLSAFDDEGKFKGLKQIFVELNDATKDLSDEERNQAFAMLGGKRQVEALTDIMSGLNHVLADGSTEWDHLYESLTNADGALERMAARRMDNLWGDVMILRSALQDAGIRAYKGFAEPLRDATQMATQAVYAFSENVSDKIEEWYPTVRGTLRGAGQDLAAFGNTLIGLGGWVIQHGSGVAGILTGIATAITAFHFGWGAIKGLDTIGKIISHLPLGLSALLGPLSAVALGVGAVAGAVTYLTVRGKKLADLNLSKHFGKTAYSMKEINQAAKNFFGAKYLEKLDYAYKQLGKSKEIAANVSAAAEEINRIVWKPGAGVEFNEEDISNLGSYIDQIVKQASDYAEQQRYQTHLTMDVFFGEDEGKKSLFNGISAAMEGNIKTLGNELGQAYYQAIEDGMISSDEASTIQQLTEKLQRVTHEAETAMADARQALFEQDLQNARPEDVEEYFSAIEEQYQTSTQQNRELHEQELGKLKYAHEMTKAGAAGYQEHEAGAVSDYGYEVGARILNENEASQNEAAVRKKIENSFSVITSAYETEFADFLRQIPDAIETTIEQSDIGNTGEVRGFLQTQFLGSEDQQQAIGQLLENIRPTIDQMETLKQEYEDAGKEIPTWLASGLHNAEALEAMSGDVDAFLSYLGEEAMNDEKFAPILKLMEENGKLLPPEFSKAVEQNKDKVDTGVNSLYAKLDESLKARFAGGMDVDVSVRFNLIPTANQLSVPTPSVKAGPVGAGSSNGGRKALGGIVTRPEYSLIGEAGYPEAVIPINSTGRAAELFAETGRMLSAAGADVGGTATYTYAPSITIQGNADAKTLQGVLRSSYDEWLRHAQRYQRDAVRLAY